MKCQGCGHDYPSTLTRCTKCSKQNPRRGRPYSDSRLIEFPRQTRAQTQTPEAPVPAWRAEVTEKVRQMRARRNGEAADGAQQPDAVPIEPEVRVAAPATASRPVSRPAVEGGLTKIRRANQDAARGIAGLSTTGAPQAGSAAGVGHDREATARALDPLIAEPQPVPQNLSKDLATPSTSRAALQSPIAQPRSDRQRKAHVESPLPGSKPGGDQPAPQTKSAEAGSAASANPANESGGMSRNKTGVAQAVSVLDPMAAPLDGYEELDPLDYLTAEVRKVDQALARELASRPTATLFSRMVSGGVDIIVIALSAVPFLVLIQMANGSLTRQPTATLAGGIVLLLSFFYLAFTQCLCGRTFGMMATNTHIADAVSRNSPTISRSLIRTMGMFVALAPGGLGILWAVFDKEGRCWQDLISGTVVVSDF